MTSTCVASAMRLYYMNKDLMSNPIDSRMLLRCKIDGSPSRMLHDLIYAVDHGYLYFWTIIEPSIGIVCACLPTLGPILRKPKAFLTFPRSISGLLGKSHGHDTFIPSRRNLTSMKKPPPTVRDSLFATSNDEISLVKVQAQSDTNTHGTSHPTGS